MAGEARNADRWERFEALADVLRLMAENTDV
jgi:hypothetical protein